MRSVVLTDDVNAQNIRGAGVGTGKRGAVIFMDEVMACHPDVLKQLLPLLVTNCVMVAMSSPSYDRNNPFAILQRALDPDTHRPVADIVHFSLQCPGCLAAGVECFHRGALQPDYVSGRARTHVIKPIMELLSEDQYKAEMLGLPADAITAFFSADAIATVLNGPRFDTSPLRGAALQLYGRPPQPCAGFTGVDPCGGGRGSDLALVTVLLKPCGALPPLFVVAGCLSLSMVAAMHGAPPVTAGTPGDRQAAAIELYLRGLSEVYPGMTHVLAIERGAATVFIEGWVDILGVRMPDYNVMFAHERPRLGQAELHSLVTDARSKTVMLMMAAEALARRRMQLADEMFVCQAGAAATAAQLQTLRNQLETFRQRRVQGRNGTQRLELSGKGSGPDEKDDLVMALALAVRAAAIGVDAEGCFEPGRW